MPWLWTEIEAHAQKNNRTKIPWHRRAVIECDRCKAIRRRYVWNKPLSAVGVFCSRKCGALGRWDAALGAPETANVTRTCARCGNTKPGNEFYGASSGARLRSQCKKCWVAGGNATAAATSLARRAQGLCTRCGEAPAASRKSRCKECLAHGNARELARQARRLSAGLCSACGKPKTIAGKVCLCCWFKRAARDTLDDQSRWVELAALWNRQEELCALTGMRLVPGTSRCALDHITAQARGGGHEIANLRWTTYDANRAKNALSDAEFLDMCRRVVETHHARSASKDQDVERYGRDAAE